MCREYGISTKTGWKFLDRFKKMGLAGLVDLSRAPKTIPHKTSPELVKLIIAERKKHSKWGGAKIKVLLERKHKREFPAPSTINDILGRAGLIEPKRHRRRQKSKPTRLGIAKAPNDIWCIDYKGQFRLGDRSLCYPLTVTDQYSRFILGCEAMNAISDESAREVCEDIFRRFGIPRAMRSNNGPPFASTGIASLTKLSAYWMLLGIRVERIRPGHPEENGRHERMHRTLKRDAVKPPGANLLQQQERFDAFVEEFNTERPHEALKMKMPGEVYRRSKRHLPESLPEPDYDDYADAVRVNASGFIQVAKRSIYVSKALVGMYVGIDPIEDDRWLVGFMDMAIGIIEPNGRLMPLSA